jgi:BioD-like phosphotransacetylase family protein
MITLGLGLMFKEAGYRIGYIKPLGKTPLKYKNTYVDADADFMGSALGIKEGPNVISPFVVSFESQNRLLQGKPSDKFAHVIKAFKNVKGKSVILIGGAADLFEGASFGLNALKIIQHVRALTLVVEPWEGDSTIDSLMGAKKLLGRYFLGAVINKIPESAHNHIKKQVRPFLEEKGIPVFASLHRDILLDSITVRQLNTILNGTVLCSEDHLDAFIENFSIGAMDVDSALKYFRRTPNKAVITGANRSDIQLAALETSTKCIILTGGMFTNDVILGKAQLQGVPMISTNDDTYTTVERIESVLGKIRIREQKKILKTKEIISKEFDFDRLLKALKIKQKEVK